MNDILQQLGTSLEFYLYSFISLLFFYKLFAFNKKYFIYYLLYKFKLCNDKWWGSRKWVI
jgi:hypothetical protein